MRYLMSFQHTIHTLKVIIFHNCGKLLIIQKMRYLCGILMLITC